MSEYHEETIFLLSYFSIVLDASNQNIMHTIATLYIIPKQILAKYISTEMCIYIDKIEITSKRLTKEIVRHLFADLKSVHEYILSKDLTHLGVMPTKYCSDELYISILERDPCMLEYIDGGYLLLNRKLSEYAVARNCSLLTHVPDELCDEAMFLLASHSTKPIAKYIHIQSLTDEMLMNSVNANGNSLKYIPDYRKTVELCKAAVKNLPDAILDVPEKFREQCATLVPH